MTDNLPIYKKEFGENFNLGFELAKFPHLNDFSYRHDVCPRFKIKIDDKYYMFFVDYEKVEDREYESNKRYAIFKAIPEETLEENPNLTEECLDVVIDDKTPLIETENTNEIVNYLNNMFN